MSISQCREKNVAWILEYELSYIRVIVALVFGISRFKFPAIMKLWKITYRKDKQTGSSCLTPADKLGKYSSFICYPFTALHKKTQKHWVFRSGFMWYWHIQWSSTCTMHMPCYNSQAHYHLTHTIRFSYTCGTGTDFSKNLNFSLSLSFHQCSILSVPIKVWTLIPWHPKTYPHKLMLHAMATASIIIKHKTWWITLADPAAIYKLYCNKKLINDV